METMTGVRKTRDQFIVRGPEREESPLRLQLSMRFKRLAKHPHQRHYHAPHSLARAQDRGVDGHER